MYYTLEKAAEVLGVTPGELNRLREAGKIRAYRDGNVWKFRKDEVDNYLAEVIKARSSGDGEDTESDLLNDSDEELPTMLADSAKFESLVSSGGVEISTRDQDDVILDDDDTNEVMTDDQKAGSSRISLGDEELFYDDDEQNDNGISMVDDDVAESHNVDLAAMEDVDRLVLGGSDSGITLAGGSDSGISLAGGSDSGIGSGDEDSALTLQAPTADTGSGSGFAILSEDERVADELELNPLEGTEKPTVMADPSTIFDIPSQDSQNISQEGTQGSKDDSSVYALNPLPESSGESTDTYGVADEATSTTKELPPDEEEGFELDPEGGNGDEDSDSASQMLPEERGESLGIGDSTAEELEGDPLGMGDFSGEDGADPFRTSDSTGGYGNMDGGVPSYGSEGSDDDFSTFGNSGGSESYGNDGSYGDGLPTVPVAEEKTCPYKKGEACVAQPTYSGMAIGLGLVPCILILILAGIGIYELVRVIWGWNQPQGLTGSVLETIGGLVKLF